MKGVSELSNKERLNPASFVTTGSQLRVKTGFLSTFLPGFRVAWLRLVRLNSLTMQGFRIWLVIAGTVRVVS